MILGSKGSSIKVSKIQEVRKGEGGDAGDEAQDYEAGGEWDGHGEGTVAVLGYK